METYSKLLRNVLRFGYRIIYKYEGPLSHPNNRYYVLAKLGLPKLKIKYILVRLKKMATDYNNCKNLSPDSEADKKHANL